uniref:Low-density lipoprotein receptor-related protein 8-like isoform X2 n=1 Tax=Geotrypetes seraphini TaxID=260995 RepID=A0A6P8RVB7_GEOSA|nr:low-density lipoprotein receptor-related protein 8-like isoform X2 [Geotrypetes seraphini]
MLHMLRGYCVFEVLLFATLLWERGVPGLPVTTCLLTQFACRAGGCIPAFWQCDGDKDCADGSDEIECREDACSGFLCSDGHCIKMAWQCDGEEDCRDGSDEISELCDKGNGTCTSKQFRCNNMWCIPQKLVCDGKEDCKDASDETDCPSASCGPQKFQCLPLGICLPTNSTCDGKKDCPDGSDESFELCQPQEFPLCADSEFQCASGHCIPEAWKCDGHGDCDDEADEADCKLSDTESIEPPSVEDDIATGNRTSHEVEKNVSRIQGNVHWMVVAFVFLGLILACLGWWCGTKSKWSFLLSDFVQISKKQTVPEKIRSSSISYMLTDRSTEAVED